MNAPTAEAAKALAASTNRTALLLPKTKHRATVLFVVATAGELSNYLTGGAVRL